MDRNCELQSENFFSVESPEEGIFLVDFTKFEGKNIWTFDRLRAFVDIISEIEKNPPKNGVIFMMGNHFGADVEFFKDAGAEEFHEFIDMIVDVFNRVEALPCQTIAVFGSCYGGGLELALACNKRLGINYPRARVGLTETNFKLFPGAGGTHRLPKLVGNYAFGLIANGKAVTIRNALCPLGMIEGVVEPDEDPYLSARSMMDTNIKDLRPCPPDTSYCDLVRDAVRESLGTGPDFAHQHVALDVIYFGLLIDPADAQVLETRAFKDHIPNDGMRTTMGKFLDSGRF